MKTRILLLAIYSIALTANASDKVKSEVELQCEPIGISYKHLATAVRNGNTEALRVFLALRFDGGGGEMFQEDWRPLILRTISDNALSDALSDLSPTYRAQIITKMTAGITGIELEALKSRFTKSFATSVTK